MNRVEVVVRRVDRFQQQHTVLGLPFAVVQKFGNDQAGGKATIIAYYGLFAVFPLLLLFSTILGFVLGGHPDLEQRVINSALADFPILGTQLRSSTHPLRGNGFALALGILGALYGAQGLGQAAQNAMNTVWNVPFKDWPGFVGRRVRGLTILVLLGVGILVSTTLVGFAPRFSGTGSSATPSPTPPTCTGSSRSSSGCCPGCISVPGSPCSPPRSTWSCGTGSGPAR